MRWHRGMFFYATCSASSTVQMPVNLASAAEGRKLTIFAPLFTTFVIKFVKY